MHFDPDIHVKFMRIALKEAQKAQLHYDIPIAALIVDENNRIISKAHNQVEKNHNSIAHAEILALNKAVKKVGYKHLLNSTIYCTLEPCSMCAGATVLARIPNIVIAAMDPKTGACGSVLNIAQSANLNHRCNIFTHVLEEESSLLIKTFFENIRRNKSNGK
jgi:tRNA(adenine34) deaminase